MNKLPKFKKRQWIYRGKKVSLSLDAFQWGKSKLSREVIHHPGAVVIIPSLQDGRILLIRQYRYPSQKVLWELPAGTLDVTKGKVEKARSCAARELQEEVGRRAGSLKRLCGFYLAPGTSTEYMDIFLAENLKPSSLPQDVDEVIEPQALEISQILQMIESGKIEDAKTIAAILYYDNFERKKT